MKSEAIKFLKIYFVFILFALLINLSLEILLRFVFEIPEALDISGIIIFFSLFNFLGAVILFFKNYKGSTMGVLSLIFGQICEFTFMKPEWVRNIYALKISMDVIMPFIISSLIYWLPAWLIPTYILHKYFIKAQQK